jgi:hypothetical protein
MISADTAFALIDKTETNLKLIEQISGDFFAPVLNEWRYAIRHIVSTFIQRDFSGLEADKALGHLKLAYFDSCDILLDCQLNLLRTFHQKCLGYSESVKKIIPEYPSLLETVRNAQKMHLSVQSKHDKEREVAFDSLAPIIDSLSDILNKLDFHADEIAVMIRRAKRWEALKTTSIVSGIIVSIVTIGQIIANVFSK